MTGPTEHDPADAVQEGPWDDTQGPRPEHHDDPEAALEHHEGYDAFGHKLDDHGHDDHGHHEVPAEDPRWVLPPLAVGLVIGIVLLVVFGLASDAVPFVGH